MLRQAIKDWKRGRGERLHQVALREGAEARAEENRRVTMVTCWMKVLIDDEWSSYWIKVRDTAEEFERVGLISFKPIPDHLRIG